MSDLIEITQNEFDIELDIRYATTNNFTGKILYDKPTCFLHKDAILALKKAIILAREQNLKFKIFDSFRPISAQQKMFDYFPDTNYVSHPQKGSVAHCRGVAIDLTLIDSAGKELNMGTEFDDFSSNSHHGCTNLSQEYQKNRYLLLGIMLSSGWDFFINEWWHYQLFNIRSYSVI